MNNTYKIFKWEDRNSGFYIAQDMNLKNARDIAKRFKHANIETFIDNNKWFEEYENGEKVSWSA